MFNYDEKKFFDCVARECPPPPRKPLSVYEEVNLTSRQLRDTLDRFMNLEKTMKDKFDDHIKILTQDNVTFKQLMQDAFSDFTSAARSEINLFETNVESMVALFKQAVNARIDEYNESHAQAFEDYKSSLNVWIENAAADLRGEYETFKTDINAIITDHGKRFDNQDAKISDAIAYMKTNLNVSIENLLTEMQEAGTLVGVLDSTVFGVPGKFGAAADGMTDDHDALTKAFALPFVVLPRGEYYVSKSVVIPETCKRIMGVGAVIKGAPGLDYKFRANGNEDLVIEGITFDSANSSRGGIILDGCNNVTVRNCAFTGYSAANGYSTTDSQINNLSSVNVLIDSCYFYDNGANYGTNSETLNRCITHDGEICKVVNCTFSNVNQGIVGNGSDLSVIGCYMFGVTDNCVYAFANSRIANNYFNSSDEGVVISGTEHVITGNTFDGIPGKSIAICGDAELVNVTGNVFKECANVLATRSNTYNVNHLAINGNTLNAKERSDNRANMVYTPAADVVDISNNIFNVNYTGANYYAVIGVDSAIDDLIINNNTFRNDGVTNNAGAFSTYGSAVISNKSAHGNVVTGNIFDGVNNKESFYVFDMRKYAAANMTVKYAAIYTLPEKVVIAMKFTPKQNLSGCHLFAQFVPMINALALSSSKTYDFTTVDGNNAAYMLNGIIAVPSDETLLSGTEYTFNAEIYK